MGKVYPITLIEGDGIGPEICAELRKVAAATGLPIRFEQAWAGGIAFEKFQSVLPEATLRLIKKNRVAIKGPVTTPIAQGFSSVNVALRKQLQLYANVRPVRSIPGVSRYADVDLVIMRENTEGLYAGLEYEIAPGVVESLKVVTRAASLKISKYAFDYAKRQGRKKVAAIHKANILKLGDGLFLDCARKIAKRYAGIDYAEMIVDNTCMQLVTRPESFDVMLMENLYGDIISDLCAGLVGGLGVVPGANIGDRYAIFEAVHGSAPDIAGKGLANPTAILLSFSMLLRHLGEMKWAARLEEAIGKTLAQVKNRTRDLGGERSTSEFGDLIARQLKS